MKSLPCITHKYFRFVLGLFISAVSPLHAQTYFVGHLNPDTDSIVAPIGAAAYYHGIPARTGKINQETQYLLNKTQYPAPMLIEDFRNKDIAAVDFNQRTQAPPQFQDGNLVEIIDHHALGDAPLTVDHPIAITIRPWGSTSTIIADMFIQNRKPIDARLATLLLGGILSDTLEFRSPTTTTRDHEVAAYLQTTAGIDDVHGLAMELLTAKSNVEDLTATEILTNDIKVFTINDRRLGFGVAETLSVEPILARRDQILKAMVDYKQREQLDLLYFCVIDTLNLNSTLLLVGNEEKALAQKAFKSEVADGTMYLPGLVSRKEQFIPMLTKASEE